MTEPSPDPPLNFAALAAVLRCESAAPAEAEPAPGTGLRYFGDYLLEEEIARGGMGIVYRAVQVSLGRLVAVKVLRGGALATGTDVERFRKEAAAAAGLQHRNIVSIHEIGEHEGRCFFSMDYVAGPTLGELLREGPMSSRRTAELIVKVARAIHHAHECGVLHRDVKPSNILMDAEGEPVVTDFGLAKVHASTDELTLSGQVLGTPAYMAPEQAAGRAGESAPAADVYGLGALMYHLLTGRPPFTGASHLAILEQVTRAEALAVRALNPSVPPDLANICATAMAREPARRYASALRLAEDAERFLSGRPVTARPLSAAGRAWRWMRRHPALASALTLSAALLAGIAVVSTVAAARLRTSRAEEAAARRDADANAWRAELNLYASDMQTAWQKYQDGAMDAMVRRLQDHIPAPGGRDPRGFEWHFLHRLAQGDQTELMKLGERPESAAFSPDGAWLITESAGHVRLRETVPLRERAAWREPASPGPRLLEAMPQSRRVVSISRAGVRLIDPDAGTVQVLSATGCGALAFSRDGALLAVAEDESNAAPKVRVLRTADWSAVHEWPGQCRGLTWEESGQLITVDSMQGAAARFTWRLPGKAEAIRTFEISTLGSPVQRAILNTPNDRFLLQLSSNECLYGVISEGKILGRRRGAPGEQLAMDPTANRMAYAGEDQAVRLWNLIGISDGPSRRGHTEKVLALAFAGSQTQLRTVSQDGTLRFWDFTRDWQGMLGRYFTPDRRTGTPVIAPDSSRAAIFLGTHATGQNDSFQIREIAAAASTRVILASPLAWHPQGEWLLALRREKVLALNPSTGREQVVLTLPAAPLAWLPRVSADWKWLAWTPDGKSLRVTALSGGRVLTEADTADAAPAFSPDGSQLALPSPAGMRLLSLADGSWQTLPFAAPSIVAWAPDGRLMAVADGSVLRLHEMPGGRCIAEYTGHRAAVCSIAWCPDGQSIVAGCEDSTLHFWHRATGRESLIMPTPAPPVLLAFAPNADWLLAGGQRGFQLLESTRKLPAVPPVMPDWAPPPAGTGDPLQHPPPPTDPADDEALLQQRLREAWEAAVKFRSLHGTWPDHLSDLRDLLPQQLDQALQHPGRDRGDGIISQNDYTDPRYPSSFHYNWCTLLVDPEAEPKDLSWATGPVSQRQYAEHTRTLYGDKVPFIRVYVLHEAGRLPAILYDGTLALLPDDWEKAYRTGWRPEPWQPRGGSLK